MATTATGVGSLGSQQKSQRSIIRGLLKVSRKVFVVVCIVYMQRGSNLPSRRSEGQK